MVRCKFYQYIKKGRCKNYAWYTDASPEQKARIRSSGRKPSRSRSRSRSSRSRSSRRSRSKTPSRSSRRRSSWKSLVRKAATREGFLWMLSDDDGRVTRQNAHEVMNRMELRKVYFPEKAAISRSIGRIRTS